MDKMLHQLGDLALGAVPTMVILLFLYVFLKAIFFNPLEKILRERHAATAGGQKLAAASIAAAEAKAAEYATQFDRARAEISKERETARAQSQAIRERYLKENREAAAERIAAAKLTIQADAAVAREGLASTSQELAESIAKTILR